MSPTSCQCCRQDQYRTLILSPGPFGWGFAMAVLTLRRTYTSPAFGSGQEVKISRRAVKTVVVTTSALARFDAALKLLFSGLGRGLPRVREAGGPAA